MPSSKRIISLYKIFIIGITLFILFRFGFLMLSKPEKQTPPSASPGKVIRGSIYDRNGRLLANQIKLKSLEVWFPHMKDQRESARLISEILEIDPDGLLKRFSERKRDYMWVQRFLSEREAQLLEKLIANGHLPGFSLRAEYKRYYPLGELGSHLLGFTNIDNIGLAGIERSMESWLNLQHSPGNKKIVYGNKVFLSIDIETQFIIDKISRKALIKSQADAVISLLMDARNGELIAYVNLPEYDPNLFNLYSEEILQNKAIDTAYEPGSVFKIFTMAAMLDTGVLNVKDLLDINTTYNPKIFQENNIPPISDVMPHGPLSVTEVLIYSSNVGMATASERISRQSLHNKLGLFGFGRVTGIQLPGESNGLLKELSQWSIRTKPTLSFGHEIGVSAIQMVTAATAFTNSGILLAPIIIKRVEEPDGYPRIENRRQPQHEVISPVTAKNMLLMMQQVVDSPLGTMRESQISGMKIAGKSGTAQVINPETGEYYQERVNSSAIAIFPVDEPRFILYSIIFNPKGNIRYGGRLISPIVREVISELTTHYNLPLTGNRIAYFSEDINELIARNTSAEEPLEETLSKIPYLIGKSKRQILPLFNHPSLGLRIHGSGHVKKQNPPPGTPIPQDQSRLILLDLWFE